MKLENHTMTFTEWFTNKIKIDGTVNDPEVRDLANEAWDESIIVNNEIYIIISKKPKTFASAIHGVKRSYKEAANLIKELGMQKEWTILMERIENNENNNK